MLPPRVPAVPWWLVPNVFALDAPLVAAVWQRFLGGVFGVPVPWAATLALAAAVWAIYLADRRLDAGRGAIDADRHRVAANFPRGFAVAIGVAGVLALLAATQLPAEYWRRGGVVAVGVGAYLVVVHALTLRGPAKELLVAVGFTAGVALPLGLDAAPAVLTFGGLCWLNCRLIARWESATPGTPTPEVAVAVTLLAVTPFLKHPIAVAALSALAGLAAVHGLARSRPRPARVLADAALLTPLAWWVVR